MSYLDIGFDENLSRTDTKDSLSAEEIDKLLPEISGERIVDYQSSNFQFLPTSPSVNAKEGQVYFDNTDRKLKVYTGSSWENLN